MKQRLIRVLVYEGSPEWINDCLAHRGVKGSYAAGHGVIKEAIVGDFLEKVLEEGVLPPDMPLAPNRHY